MTAVLVVLVTVFVIWRVRRGRRAAQLAGLQATKPTFSVEPPTRSLYTMKDYRL